MVETTITVLNAVGLIIVAVVVFSALFMSNIDKE